MFSSETLEIFNNTSGRLLLNCLNLKKETFSDRSFRGLAKPRNFYISWRKIFADDQSSKLQRVISFQVIEIKKNKINLCNQLFFRLYYGFNNPENYHYYFNNNIIIAYNVQKRNMFDVFDQFDDEERLFLLKII